MPRGQEPRAASRPVWTRAARGPQNRGTTDVDDANGHPMFLQELATTVARARTSRTNVPTLP